MDSSNGIALDRQGGTYVTGITHSADYPTTPGGFDTTFNDPSTESGGDAFVTKFTSDGRLAYSTFLGGRSADTAFGIAVDGDGRAFVTGLTDSARFPTTPRAFARHLRGVDAFVTALDATGSALAYSTFLGGSGLEIGMGIAVDGQGSAFVTGLTRSSNYPSTRGAFDRTLNGSSDGFVTKLTTSRR